ncbi:helix-turn-helix domain-containing protein [Kineococcus sp. SYSU DK005]|uniref:helix-turn-helix domain-containing protein n=1 Tax=Kineococcus sp. SYSU DK005 TaxID=3383126 RepID=UPI003D7EEF8E
MSSSSVEGTVHPGIEGLDDLARVLAAGGPVVLRAGRRSAVLPEELLAALRESVAALRHGEAVTYTAHEAMLTTQEAAEVLGVSRPTLVRLLESGALPYTKLRTHRRVRLEDVLEYARRHHHDGPGVPAPR